MLMGDVCTRHCGFCAVAQGAGKPLDPEEPRHVAEAVKTLGVAHAVVTSVNRDELPDGGAAHFAATIREIRALAPGVTSRSSSRTSSAARPRSKPSSTRGRKSSTTTRRPSSASTGACGRTRSTRGRWSSCVAPRRDERRREDFFESEERGHGGARRDARGAVEDSAGPPRERRRGGHGGPVPPAARAAAPDREVLHAGRSSRRFGEREKARWDLPLESESGAAASTVAVYHARCAQRTVPRTF